MTKLYATWLSRMYVFCVAFALVGIASVAHGEETARKRLPSFQTKTLKGKRLRSSGLEGKVTVISLWASWCGPCKYELEALDDYAKEYQGKGLQVLAIATDGPETIAAVRSVARRKRWKFDVATDPQGRATAVLNPKGSVPYTIFVDRKGQIAHIHAGYKKGDESQYKSIIESLLAEG